MFGWERAEKIPDRILVLLSHGECDDTLAILLTTTFVSPNDPDVAGNESIDFHGGQNP